MFDFLINAIVTADVVILDWLTGAFQFPWLMLLMRLVSLLTSFGALWIVLTAALAFFKGTRRTAIAMAVALVLSFLITNVAIKPMVERPRPFDAGVSVAQTTEPDDFSFPSGHTSAAFAAAFAYTITSKRKQRLFDGIIISFAALVALSRLILMVHYPSDVIAGLFVGVICANIAVALTAPKKKPKGPTDVNITINTSSTGAIESISTNDDINIESIKVEKAETPNVDTPNDQ